jgi:hypothetical protein
MTKLLYLGHSLHVDEVSIVPLFDDAFPNWALRLSVELQLMKLLRQILELVDKTRWLDKGCEMCSYTLQAVFALHLNYAHVEFNTDHAVNESKERLLFLLSNLALILANFVQQFVKVFFSGSKDFFHCDIRPD